MDEIRALLPHREPFLFVDEIVERGAGRIVTAWRVREDADFLRGHYPGFPLVPGALLLESVFQSGALLAALDEEVRTPSASMPVLVKIGQARFRRMVRPGEELRIEVTLEERAASARAMTGRVTAGGESVLRVEFTVAAAALPAEAP